MFRFLYYIYSKIYLPLKVRKFVHRAYKSFLTLYFLRNTVAQRQKRAVERYGFHASGCEQSRILSLLVSSKTLIVGGLLSGGALAFAETLSRDLRAPLIFESGDKLIVSLDGDETPCPAPLINILFSGALRRDLHFIHCNEHVDRFIQERLSGVIHLYVFNVDHLDEGTRQLANALAHRRHLIVADSEHGATKIVTQWGVPSDRVIVRRQSANPARVQSNWSKFNVDSSGRCLWVGGGAYKGAEAFEAIVASSPKLNFIAIDPDRHFSSPERYLNLRVYDSFKAISSGCDVAALIFLSTSEGRPNVLLEAIECEIPILALTSPAVMEIQADNPASVRAFDSTKEMQAALEALASN